MSYVKYFIIDEADRMLDMGFEPQLNQIVFEKDLCENKNRQNLLFSATFDDQIKNIAKKFMNECYYIQTKVEMQSNSNIKQMFVYATENEKIVKLHQILQTVNGSIISNDIFI